MKTSIPSILLFPFILSGCVAGTVVSGEHRLLHEDFPDVRTVPSREEATRARSAHGVNEKTERAEDFHELEQERAQQKNRDEKLRSQEVDLPPIPEIPEIEIEEINEVML